MAPPKRLNKKAVFQAVIAVYESELRTCEENVERFKGSASFPNASQEAEMKALALQAMLDRLSGLLQAPAGAPSASAEGSLVVTTSRYTGSSPVVETHYHLIFSGAEVDHLKINDISVALVPPDFFGNAKAGATFTTRRGRPGEDWDVENTVVDIY